MNRPAVDRFAATLQQVAGAERVLLFGSRARGGARPDSDYDFIVVSPLFSAQSRRERPVGLYRFWYEAEGDAPLDLVCLTPEEFDDAAQRISLVSAVLPEALVLLSPTNLA